MNRLETVRKVAKMGLASENYIRCLIRRGRCPGIQVGNRFLVNVPLLSEQLDAESRRAVEPEGRA